MDSKNKSPLFSGLAVFFIAVCHFVCPLVFFTDLTRNPYYFQIALLNASLFALAVLTAVSAFKTGKWEFSKSALDLPWLAWLGLCFASVVFSYFGHGRFFRPAILSESFRIALFTSVNCFFAYWISKNIPSGPDPADVRLPRWAWLLPAWAVLWSLYPVLKSPSSAVYGTWGRIWDPYGGMLWLLGLGTVLWLIRRGRQEDFWHLAFSAGAFAAAYGLFQYFQIEIFWPKVLNPYGSRSVSTFGNPNFVSSYLVVLLPLVLAYLLQSRTVFQGVFYGGLFLLYEASLLCSLTRSSWLGAATALLFLAAFREYRARITANKKIFSCFFGLAVVMTLFWPGSSLKSYRMSVVERVAELSNIDVSRLFAPPSGVNAHYSPWHQRLLIWTCCWQMGRENPLFGKGWGTLELFYPFYQGPLMEAVAGDRGLRTHANNAHNEILEIWSQTGLAGLGVFAWFFAVLFAWFWRFHASAPENERYWTVPLAAGTAGMLADNMLNVSMHFAVPGFIFWWQIGSLSSRISGGSPPLVFSWDRRIVHRASAFLIIVISLGGILLWHAQFMREIHYFLGFKHMRRNDFSRAAQELKAAYDWNPREVNNNYELGNAYARINDFEKAKWAYGEAIKTNCGYDEIFFNLAVISGRKLGNWADAVRNFETSLFINPLNPQAYAAVTEAYAKNPGQYARRGAETSAQAVRLFPQDPSNYSALGYFYTLLNDYPRAREAYSSGLRVDPGNAMLETNLRRVLARSAAATDETLDWVRLYREMESRVARLDFSGETLDLAGRVVKGNPVNVQSRILLAKILYQKDRFGEAEDYLRQAVSLNPDSATAHLGLAFLFEKKGAAGAAKYELGQVLRIDPANRIAAEKLAALGQ